MQEAIEAQAETQAEQQTPSSQQKGSTGQQQDASSQQPEFESTQPEYTSIGFQAHPCVLDAKTQVAPSLGKK